MTLAAAHLRAVRIWNKFGRRIELADLKGQAALISLQVDREDTLYHDLLDYAQYQHRRIMRPLPKRERGAACVMQDPWILLRASELPDRQRRAVRLVYVDGFTQREAASRMGVTEGRVSQILKQALGTLRERMGAK